MIKKNIPELQIIEFSINIGFRVAIKPYCNEIAVASNK